LLSFQLTCINLSHSLQYLLLSSFQVLDGDIRLMPHVGVPERPIVGDGKNFPSRWQPKIPTAGTLGLEPVVYPH